MSRKTLPSKPNFAKQAGKKRLFLGYIVIHFILLALFVFTNAYGGNLFRQPLGASKFFVIVKCNDRDMSEYCMAMLKKALCRSEGFVVLDLDTVRKLKSDEIVWKKLEDADPSILKEISQKYSVDYELNGTLSVNHKLLATQYEGTALLSVKVIRTRDGVEIGTATSYPVGGVENPGPIRELALPAKQSAVTLATNDIIGKLCLPGGFEPEDVIKLNLRSKFLYSLEHPGTAVAISGNNQCYVGTTKYIICYNLLTDTQPKIICDGRISTLAIWPDNTTLVSGYFDGSIQVWDTVANHHIWKARPNKSEVTSLAILPEKDVIAAGCMDGSISLFDRKSSVPIIQWNAHDGKAVQSLGFTYDGEYLLSAGADKKLCKWHVENARSVFSFLETTRPGKRFLGNLFAAAFTREGNIIAVAFQEIYLPKFGKYRTDNNYLCLHDCEGVPPTEQYRFEAHDEAIESLALCPTSCRFLASGSRDGIVKIWDLQLRHSVFEDSVGGSIEDMDFSPQANWFAVVTREGKGLFNKKKGQLLKVWRIE